MLVSIVRTCQMPVTIVCNRVSAFDGLELGPEVRWLELGSLVDRGPVRRQRDVWRYMSASLQHTHNGVVGADVMDGRYFATSSLTRCSLLLGAARQGNDVAVFGFSWSGEPLKSATFALKRLAEGGGTLYVREPTSYERLVASGVHNLRLVADVAFLLGKLPTDGVSSARDENTRKVFVNVSGLVDKHGVPIEVYARLVESLLDNGYSVEILPHVIRPGDSDLDPQNRLEKRIIADPKLTFVRELLTPDGVQRRINGATLVITGRMHLGILAMSLGVPAIIVNTNGKAEGVYRLFDLPKLSVELSKLQESHESLAEQVANIEELGVENIAMSLRGKIADVMSSAHSNFEWLARAAGQDKITATLG